MSRDRGFPEFGELVVCSVFNVKNFGAMVTLDEYEDREGFIHIRDVATGWIKYIKDYVREGQKVVCKVIGTDPSKGHIDLSLKSVNEHQKREKIQQWKNEKKAEKLVEIISERMGISIDEAYDEFGNQMLEEFETLYNAFESAVADPDAFLEDFEGVWVEAFLEVAKENVTPPFVQIDGVLEMASGAPNGVDLIKKALNAGLKAAEDEKVEITCIGSPRYRIVVIAEEYKIAEEVLKTVSTAAIASMSSAGGTAALKRESR